MKTNTRFAVALHILAAISLNKKAAMTSTILAKSINTNPVVVRKILSRLKKADIIISKPGVKGLALKRGSLSISLLEVYNALKDEKTALLHTHKNTNEKCFIGANIHSAILPVFQDVQNLAERALDKYSLKDITRPISKKAMLGNTHFFFPDIDV